MKTTPNPARTPATLPFALAEQAEGLQAAPHRTVRDGSDPAVRAAGVAAEALIERLGRALHRFGSPAHRLESALTLAARRLGLEAQFFSTPTAVFATFRPLDEPSSRARVVLLRVEPGDVDLERLSRLDRVLARVVDGAVTPHEAIEEVAAIEAAPARYSRFATVASFALASGSTARFFGGGLTEVAAAGSIGLCVGLLALAVESRSHARRLFEALASTLAAFGAGVAAVAFDASVYVVTVAALIVLVPGLTLTVAMAELATRHLVSGAARLSGAFLMFVTMGVGAAVGRRVAEASLGGVPVLDAVTPARWTELPALAVAALGLLVLFRAAPGDLGWFIAAAALALAGGRAGAALVGPELGALLGALLIGVGGNLFARLRDRPSAIIQMPGLMLLVPGSMGFRSVTALVEQNTLAGVQTAFTVTLVAMSLVTGLLLANVVLPPRRML
ncbi:MAG: threonine/serine exporter family protein [Acidobacteriota bacterium]